MKPCKSSPNQNPIPEPTRHMFFKGRFKYANMIFKEPVNRLIDTDFDENYAEPLGADI